MKARNRKPTSSRVTFIPWMRPESGMAKRGPHWGVKRSYFVVYRDGQTITRIEPAREIKIP